MNKEAFWIFGHLGLGDHIVCNALYRTYASLHQDKFVIIPCWLHNMAAIQWMLSDVPNIFFYPVENEQQLLTCRNGQLLGTYVCLGFYEYMGLEKPFNPVLWDSEFYRQAGLDPEMKWKGFKLPSFKEGMENCSSAYEAICHDDDERGFSIKDFPLNSLFLDKTIPFASSCLHLNLAKEIHCIDSSMLNLADLMETPYCKRFVFHKYARKGLPPKLKKNWEVLE